MTASDLLREAITTRKAVAATYDGHPRRFCPHKLGWTASSTCSSFSTAAPAARFCPPEATGAAWKSPA